jgi:hypothetical protein
MAGIAVGIIITTVIGDGATDIVSTGPHRGLVSYLRRKW